MKRRLAMAAALLLTTTATLTSVATPAHATGSFSANVFCESLSELMTCDIYTTGYNSINAGYPRWIINGEYKPRYDGYGSVNIPCVGHYYHSVEVEVVGNIGPSATGHTVDYTTAYCNCNE